MYFWEYILFEKPYTFGNIRFFENHVLSINILRKHVLFRKSAFFKEILIFRKYIPFKKSAFFQKTRVGRPIAVFSDEKRIYLVGG